MRGNFLKKKINKNESGYILAFTLVVVAVLLLISISITRIIAKEMYFSRLVDNNRVAYFAADSGLECAQYIDNKLRDNTTGISIILNAVLGTNPKYEFEQNILNNVFNSTSTVYSVNSEFNINTDPNNISSILPKIYCASDNTYNQIFTVYASTTQKVRDNLSGLVSSYNIVGDSSHATTTFGFILKQKNIAGDEVDRCVLVEFAKTRNEIATDTIVTSYFSINSTGYSSCNSSDPSRVSRTIHRYSTE